eukprot:g16080.t1
MERTSPPRAEILNAASGAAGLFTSNVGSEGRGKKTLRLDLKLTPRENVGGLKELRISCHFLAERVSAEALTGKISTVTKSLQALAESETCSQERLDAHLARIKELFRRENGTQELSIHSPDIAKIAGAVGTARLAGDKGWKHLLADFKAILLEHLIEFREEEFYNMSWIFPTVYLTEIELRQVLARAAEIQASATS